MSYLDDERRQRVEQYAPIPAAHRNLMKTLEALKASGCSYQLIRDVACGLELLEKSAGPLRKVISKTTAIRYE